MLSDGSASSALDHPAQVSHNDYTELGDGQVMEVLSKHLEKFLSNSVEEVDSEEHLFGRSSCSGLVLYRDAIEHCARLYRVMVC